MASAVDHFSQRGLFGGDIRSCRFNLGTVIRVLKFGENLGAVDDIAFLDENGFQAAAQFGADLDVFRVRLDVARSGNQRGALE